MEFFSWRILEISDADLYVFMTTDFRFLYVEQVWKIGILTIVYKVLIYRCAQVEHPLMPISDFYVSVSKLTCMSS